MVVRENGIETKGLLRQVFSIWNIVENLSRSIKCGEQVQEESPHPNYPKIYKKNINEKFNYCQNIEQMA